MVDLSKVVKNLKSEFSTISVAEEKEDPQDFISSGNLALDLVLDGGFPYGSVIELLGLSQSGKSLLIQKAIANSMKKYPTVGVLANRENAYTKKRGEQLGIDNNSLLVAYPSDIPDVQSCFLFIFNSIAEIRKQDKDCYIAVGIDSISAFGKDVAFEKSDSGRKAKATHEGLREVLKLMDDKIILLVANQVTYKIGVMYGDPRTTTAGESMKYYSNVRLALQDAHKVVDKSKGNEILGNWIEIEVIKTRFGPCFRSCYLQHLYKEGISTDSGYVRLLVNRGYLKPKNKEEFRKFSQETVIWTDGTVKEQYSEFGLGLLFEKHPELNFTSYPEYNSKEIQVGLDETE